MSNRRNSTGRQKEPDKFSQVSIFQIINQMDWQENSLSSDDISEIIDRLYEGNPPWGKIARITV